MPLDRLKASRWFGPCAASLVAAILFALDVQPGSDGAIGVLYAVVVILGALNAGPRAAYVWCGLSALLAVSSCLWTHSPDDGPPEVLHLFLALVTIALVGTLMLSRQELLAGRKQLEETGRAQQALLDCVPQVLWGTRADGVCDFLNSRFTEVTGIDVAQAIREQSWASPIHPEDRQAMLEIWSAALRSGNDFRAYGRIQRSDGTYRWMRSTGRPVRSPETGEIVRWLGALVDVDEEVRDKQTIVELNQALERVIDERTAELEQTRWRFRSLYDDPNIFVAEQNWEEAGVILKRLKAQGVTDLRAYLMENHDVLQACVNGVRTVDVNDAIWKKLGYSSKAELVTKAPRDGVIDAVAALLPQLEALYENRDYVTATTTLVRADGGRMPVIFAVNFMANGTAYATLFDITEREAATEMKLAAQQELARANRTAAVGALSISIAHELNQPLASMSIDVELGLQALTKEQWEREMIVRLFERLRRNVRRLSDIVQHTREKIANQPRASQAVDLPALAEETRMLLEREVVARRAVVKVRAEPGVPPVAGDKVALQQVLVNLIINALDAVAAVPEDLRNVEVFVEREGDQVRVRVVDSGPGIRSEDLANIFQPFFTTKTGGIGMGLQICRTSIEALGGKLYVANQPLGGASFQFVLPPMQLAAA